MLKFIILLVIITTAHTSDVDTYLGKARSVAVFPKLQLDRVELCPWYDVSLANVKCTCGDRNESISAELLTIKIYNHNNTEVVIAISVVNTEAEAFEFLTKYDTCKCGENMVVHGVYRPINNKFYILYLIDPDNDENPMVTIIVSKYKDTKTDVEHIIQSIDELKTREYKLLCEYI